MARCCVLPEAVTDVEQGGDYIAANNPARAASLVAELRGVYRRLAERPSIGVARDRLRPGLRMFPTRGHLILYTVTDDGIHVVRALRASRDMVALF